jgi:hypothetical protein
MLFWMLLSMSVEWAQAGGELMGLDPRDRGELATLWHAVAITFDLPGQPSGSARLSSNSEIPVRKFCENGPPPSSHFRLAPRKIC